MHSSVDVSLDFNLSPLSDASPDSPSILISPNSDPDNSLLPANPQTSTVICTGWSSYNALNHAQYRGSPTAGNQRRFHTTYSNPYPPQAPPVADETPPPACIYTTHLSRVCVVPSSSDLRLSLSPVEALEELSPDLECSICFSQFNNVFRCPKMLQCKHTFCLECLARINIKAAQPSAIQCPLCRSLTPLPALGLPKLTTDPEVLSYLPTAMQTVYSIRFNRSKGKLQIKRSSEGRWGQRSLTSLSLMRNSLDVGLPSSRDHGVGERGGALFRLTGQPACRAFLLVSVVVMIMLLVAVVIFLVFKKQPVKLRQDITRQDTRWRLNDAFIYHGSFQRLRLKY